MSIAVDCSDDEPHHRRHCGQQTDRESYRQRWPVGVLQAGKLEFIVDTGFTGDMLIPRPLVNLLILDLLSYDTFELATEQLIELPVFRGNVVIGKTTLEVEMVPGDALIGMSLMQAIGSQLLFDFDKGQVLLRG